MAPPPRTALRLAIGPTRADARADGGGKAPLPHLPLITRSSLPQVDLPTECINAMALLHSASTAAQQFGQNMMNAAAPALTDNSAPSAADVSTSEFMTSSPHSGSPHLSPALQLLADVSGSAGAPLYAFNVEELYDYGARPGPDARSGARHALRSGHR